MLKQTGPTPVGLALVTWFIPANRQLSNDWHVIQVPSSPSGGTFKNKSCNSIHSQRWWHEQPSRAPVVTGLQQKQDQAPFQQVRPSGSTSGQRMQKFFSPSTTHLAATCISPLKKCSTATMRATICFFKNVKPELDTARSVSKARKCQVYQWQTFRPFPCSNVDNVLGWGSAFFPFTKEYPLSVSWNASSQQIFIVLRIWRRHVIVNWFPVKISSWFIGKIIISGVATLPIFMKIWWCVERHQKNIYLKF